MHRSWAILALSLWPSAASASVNVCIQVDVKSWVREAPRPKPPAPVATPPAPAAPAAKPGAADPDFDPIRDFYGNGAPRSSPARDPHELDPAAYLRRLLEYEVTHAEGFVAVADRCQQRMLVELYPLESGWTVFARYSGTGREEKVDRVELDEFEPLAQRTARALLENRAISDTITRENVLRSDSARAVRTVRGRSHATFAMGTAFRVGQLPTAESPEAPVESRVRVLTPFDVHLGYRLKIRSWGLDAFSRVNFGTDNTALRSNQVGGHVDYAGSGALGLHFLRYFDGVGVNSLYAGGGASLELSLFDIIRHQSAREDSQRSWLMGGGLNVDLLIGHEFLRASVVHFFAQAELAIPTYVFDTENAAGSLRTYLPGGLVQVGVIL